MQSKASIARASANLLALLSLTACGGGVMSSFDSEKSRVRSALSADIPCTEGTFGSGKVLDCRSTGGGLKVSVGSETTGPGSLDVSIVWEGRRGDGEAIYPSFRKLADAYGMTEADENACRSTGGLPEQSDTFQLKCTAIPDGFNIVIVRKTRA